MPTTANRLTVNAWGNKRGRTLEYKAWAESAGWALRLQAVPAFTGQVRLDMTIVGGKGFSMACDLTNRWKALEDLLVTHGILKDDNVQYVVGHCDRYEPPTSKDSVARCILTIESVQKGEEG